MGLPDVVFLPFRAARRVAGAVVGAVSPAPSAGETIVVATDIPALVTLAALPPGTKVELDGTLTGAKVAVPRGRHRIHLATS